MPLIGEITGTASADTRLAKTVVNVATMAEKGHDHCLKVSVDLPQVKMGALRLETAKL